MPTIYRGQMVKCVAALALTLSVAFGLSSSPAAADQSGAVRSPVLDRPPPGYPEPDGADEYSNPGGYVEPYSANTRWDRRHHHRRNRNQGRPPIGDSREVFRGWSGYPTGWSQLGGPPDPDDLDGDGEERMAEGSEGVVDANGGGVKEEESVWDEADSLQGGRIREEEDGSKVLTAVEEDTGARSTPPPPSSSDAQGSDAHKHPSPANSSSGCGGGGEVREPEEGSGGEASEYDYEYDIEESWNTFNWAELVPALVVYSLTFVAGVTGNFLIIMATTSCCKGSSSGGRGFESRYGVASAAGRLHTPSPTNVFLASLASADLLLILICIPVKILSHSPDVSPFDYFLSTKLKLSMIGTFYDNVAQEQDTETRDIEIAKLFSYTWTMGAFLCKFVHYMQNVSAICSVLTLTAISLERYYAIVHPMKAKYTCTVGQATKIVLGTWAASFLLAIPILFAQVHMSVGERISAFWCVRDWENVELWQFHELYMLLLILVLPTCVMAGAYASICWEIWKVMRRRYTMTCGRKGINPPITDPLGNGSEFTRGENIRLSKTNHHSRRVLSQRRMNHETSEMESGTVRKVIKMLVAVVVLFVICWAPILIDNVLTAYGVLPNIRQSHSPLKHMATAFHLMAYFNSCINPIVYGFMSKSFRISFYKVLCRCCYKGRRSSSHPKRNPSTNSQTRTTSVRYTDTSSGRSMSMTTA